MPRRRTSRGRNRRSQPQVHFFCPLDTCDRSEHHPKRTKAFNRKDNLQSHMQRKHRLEMDPARGQQPQTIVIPLPQTAAFYQVVIFGPVSEATSHDSGGQAQSVSSVYGGNINDNNTPASITSFPVTARGSGFTQQFFTPEHLQQSYQPTSTGPHLQPDMATQAGENTPQAMTYPSYQNLIHSSPIPVPPPESNSHHNPGQPQNQTQTLQQAQYLPSTDGGYGISNDFELRQQRLQQYSTITGSVYTSHNDSQALSPPGEFPRQSLNYNNDTFPRLTTNASNLQVEDSDASSFSQHSSITPQSK